MKKIKLIIYFLIINYTYKAQQNLVPNGSFEDTLGCPMFSNELYKCKNWFNPSIFSSPDYFNSCDLTNGVSVPKNFGGFQNAFEGKAYAGLIVYFNSMANYREYVAVKLQSTLIASVKYRLSLNISLADSCNFASSNLAFAFYTDTIGIDKPILTPTKFNNFNNTLQINKSDWTEIDEEFIANGNENYLILGNFQIDASTTFSNIGGGGIHGDYASAYYYIDKIQLTESFNNSNISDFEINAITPNGDGINDNVDFTKFNLNELEFEVFNRWGNLVFKSNNVNLKWNGINNNQHTLPPGTYYYIINAKQNNNKIQKHSYIQLIF